NDEDGNAMVYSQSYRSKKSRDNAIKSVIKNVAVPKHLAKKESPEDGHFFIIKGGNNQEIARSRFYAKKSEMNNFIGILRKIDENVPVVEVTPKTAIKKEPTKKVKKEMVESRAPTNGGQRPPRDKFSITHYPDSGVWVIKNDLSEATENFKNFNEIKIKEFIQSQIPEVILEESEGQGFEIENLEMQVQGKSGGQEPEPGNGISGIKFVTKDGQSTIKSIKKADFSAVAFKIPVLRTSDDNAIPYSARVFVKSLRSFKQLFIGEVTDFLAVEQGKLSIPIVPDFLERDLYKVRVYFQPLAKGQTKLYGDKVFLLS
ncbi:MAG: DUF1508 domain-containing protein, partial [Bacteroidetes bacterium]